MRDEKDMAAVRVENGIAWLSFNRPEKRNCMNPGLNRRMMELLDEIEFRDELPKTVTGKIRRTELREQTA